jgi:PAS domain S-box-containing protein
MTSDNDTAPDLRSEPLREALLDSRLRWRDLVCMACDFAFETDARGRFVFVSPDPALGWPVEALLGQPANLLMGAAAAGTAFNPFAPDAAFRRRRVWLKRYDGPLACLSFSAAPLFDHDGRIVGTRGVATDVTERDAREAQVAAACAAASCSTTF